MKMYYFGDKLKNYVNNKISLTNFNYSSPSHLIHDYIEEEILSQSQLMKLPGVHGFACIIASTNIRDSFQISKRSFQNDFEEIVNSRASNWCKYAQEYVDEYINFIKMFYSPGQEINLEKLYSGINTEATKKAHLSVKEEYLSPKHVKIEQESAFLGIMTSQLKELELKKQSRTASIEEIEEIIKESFRYFCFFFQKETIAYSKIISRLFF